jgi:hypothetical protein
MEIPHHRSCHTSSPNECHRGQNQPSAACVCPRHIGFPYQAWLRLMFNAKRNRVLGWFAANVSSPGCSSLLCYKDLFTIAPTSRIRRSRCISVRALCSQTCSLFFSSPCDAHRWSVRLRFATTTGVYFRTRASGSRVSAALKCPQQGYGSHQACKRLTVFFHHCSGVPA